MELPIELVSILSSALFAIGAAILTYYLKTQKTDSDNLSAIMARFDALEKHFSEFRGEVKTEIREMRDIRENMVLLRNETKTQWKKIDENADRIRDLSAEEG